MLAPPDRRLTRHDRRRGGPAAKAAILVEALPYIRRFWGQVVVVKYGGTPWPAAQAIEHRPSAGRAGALASFATDIVLMRSVGMRPLVVHGGGPQIGELMTRLGKVPEFIDGLRVTDAETLDIARMVLVGKVNRDIVSAINVHAPLAVGVSGEDAGLISAEARDPQLGFVGDVTAVNPDLLNRLLAEDLIPVVATIGSDPTGQAYNINADTAAGAVAEAVGATKLVYLTDVDGIRADRDDPASRLSSATTDELAAHAGRRHGRRRHDPQGPVLRARRQRRRRPGPHPRRPPRATPSCWRSSPAKE